MVMFASRTAASGLFVRLACSWCSVLLGALALLDASSARAFECTPVPQCPGSGDPSCVEPRPPVLTQAWNQRTIQYWIRENDPLFSLPGMENIVRASFDRWSAQVPCTDLQLVFAGYANEGIGFDNQSLATQRNMVLSAQDPQALAGFVDDPGLVALTLTSFIVQTGEILDADIVFNQGVNRFAVVEQGLSCAVSNPPLPFDIENTMVHEVGHFIGFDHVVDDREATMFPNASPCETKKRDLAQDDLNGVCSVYPAGGPTSTCHPPAEESGCTCASVRDPRSESRSIGLGAAMVFALGLFLQGRRCSARARVASRRFRRA